MSCLLTIFVIVFVLFLLGSLFGSSPPPVEMGSNGYTKDWGSVASKTKKKKSWVCQECKVDCSGERNLVHVHHKNRDRKDNSEGNLMVLCIQCHGKQPGKGHSRLMATAQKDGRWDRISKLRKEQNGSWW